MKHKRNKLQRTGCLSPGGVANCWAKVEEANNWRNPLRCCTIQSEEEIVTKQGRTKYKEKTKMKDHAVTTCEYSLEKEKKEIKHVMLMLQELRYFQFLKLQNKEIKENFKTTEKRWNQIE